MRFCIMLQEKSLLGRQSIIKAEISRLQSDASVFNMFTPYAHSAVQPIIDIQLIWQAAGVEWRDFWTKMAIN
jgi:hypothetical protein